VIVELLNKLKWDKKYDFSKVKIYYVSRGDANNIAVLQGNEIKNLGKMFIETTKIFIPYHRIIKIEYEGKVIYEKK